MGHEIVAGGTSGCIGQILIVVAALVGERATEYGSKRGDCHGDDKVHESLDPMKPTRELEGSRKKRGRDVRACERREEKNQETK